MPVVTLFKNRKGPVNVATPKGERIKFANGMFFTHNKEHEEYLQGLADRKECGVYVDPNQPSIDTDAMTPHDMLKAKIIREYEEDKIKAARANAAAQTNPGNSVQGNPQQSVANTTHTATPQVTPPTVKAPEPETVKASGVEVPKELEAAKSGASAKVTEAVTKK